MLKAAENLTVAAKAVKKMSQHVAQQYLEAAAFFKAAAKHRAEARRGSARR